MIRVYSDVVKAGLILPRKNRYTGRDVNRVMVDSLFNQSGTLSYKEARFVVICSAVFHDTDYRIKQKS